MDDNDLWRLDASSLDQLLGRSEISPVDLLNLARRRMDHLNPKLNAVVTINENAEDEARASEARRQAGRALSPLDGVPITVKDNLLAGGMRATWGSKLFEHHIPDADELPVARLRASGAVILGKTNVPEFTLEGYTSNALFGTTGNPWNPVLTPGGSSGGGVASVAAGIVPVAIGTDGGGSIRRPAGYGGLVGLKSSIGRIPRLNGFLQLLLDFEVVGTLTRTVTDTALLFKMMAGADPRVPMSLGHGRQDTTASGLLRILYVERLADNPLDPIIAQSCRDAAKRLTELGHTVEEGSLPFDLSALNDVWADIGQISLGLLFERHPQAKQLATPRYAEMAERGAKLQATYLLEILDLVTELRARAGDAFETIDVIMTPSSAAMPWPAEQAFPPEIDGQPVGPRGHAVYTGWVNAIGYPALNLPSAPAPDGMPIGYQLVGRFGTDEMLLTLGDKIEQAAPWAERWPAIAKVS